jgi:signal transduction histidine kinase
MHKGEKAKHIDAFLSQIKLKSDKLINYFLVSFFLGGLAFASFYDTLEVAFGIGSLSLLAYYSAKAFLPQSNLYQYVLSAVFGIFMAQYIYQMHGMFEMHFVAFIGSAMLITYQNWKLQIPLVLVVVVHHALFGYLQFVGYDKIYFTQLEYMDLQTFVIHVVLAAVIFFICALWAHHFKKYSERHIEQTFEMGRLLEERKQKDALLQMSESLKMSNERLNEAQRIASIGSWTWDTVTNYVERSDEFYNILERSSAELTSNPEAFLQCVHPDDRNGISDHVRECVAQNKDFAYEARIILPSQKVKTIFAQGQAITEENGHLVVHGTIQDITARKAYEEALEKSNADLRKSNHELDKFVYSVSHDLRAPLLSMQGIVEITQEETEEELTREHMIMVKGSISRLDTFIGDILNYSRNARSEMKPVQLDLHKVLSEIVDDLQYMGSETKKVNVTMDISQNGAFYTDNGRFRIIVNNLISNAIRYHNPEAETPYVKVSARANDSVTLLEVEDNGIGIPEEYQQKIFEMFYRVSENSNGSGLGLYIVKETVDKLNGTVDLVSNPGKGTKFTLSIPNLCYQ